MKHKAIFTAVVGCLLATLPIQAQRVMENLGRGVIAVHSNTNVVYVGWRLLASDPAGVAFNLYRTTNGQKPVKLNPAPLATTTDFVDSSANLSLSNSYFVRAVVNGVEQASSAPFTVLADTPVGQYLQIPIQRPPDGVESCPAPAGVTPPRTYSYSANDGSIGDLDGDGEYEIVLKWDPSNSRDNGLTSPGCAGLQILDAYKLDGKLLWRINLGRNIRSGAHYTQFMVYDLDGDGKAEVAMKTADGTVDGVGHVIGDPNADYVNGDGRILSGPEYLTIFDGKTGTALATTDYVPSRGNMAAKEFGDNYGNRSDRFLATIAYLDGVRPSLVMARGYYAKTTLAAWDWRNGKLTLRWFFNSKDPAHPEYLAFEGQGNHSISVADVDNDGKDDIIYGSAVINSDGTGRFSTGWGHGDAMHASRFDPNNPDVLVFGVHENSGINTSTCSAAAPKYGSTLYNARTGQLLWGTDLCNKKDFGRGLASALDPNRLGAFFWGGNLIGGKYWTADINGQPLFQGTPSNNFAVWWDSDVLREQEDGTSVTKFDVTTVTAATLLNCAECASNNGSKSNPVLTGDLFGDWREEVVWRTSDNKYLRVYTTTIPAANRMYTLLQDPQYRLALAWQNVAYNQPPWPSFYIGPGMAEPPQPNLVYPAVLAADLTTKNGPPPKRVWTLRVTNMGTAPAPAVQIESFSLTHVAGSGPMCDPVITSPTQFPILLGTIAPGATVQQDINLNVTNCSSNARLKLVVPVTAMNGAATAMIVRDNEPR